MEIYSLRLEVYNSTQQFYFDNFPSREDLINALEGYPPYIKMGGLEVLEKIEGWFDCNRKDLQELYVKGDVWGRNITLDSFYCHHVAPTNPDESIRNYGHSFLISTTN